MSAHELHTNPKVYVLQAQYAVNNFQGNSRWTIVEPISKTLHGAIGKDQVPPVFSKLKTFSAGMSVQDDRGLDSLIRNKLLVAEESLGERPNVWAFLPHYHEFVKDYPFNDYASASRWGKDRELMFEYGKIAEPPPVYTDWDEHHGDRVQLPPPYFRDLFKDVCILEPTRALATALAGALQATGSIDGGDFGPWLRKTSPSGGARHPTEAVVTVYGVDNIKDGVYSYDPQTHQLVGLENPPQIHSDPGSQPRINLSLVSRVERPMWRYRETRSFRAVLIDAGHVATMLSSMFSLLGYSLEADRLPQSIGETINFDAPVLATFRLLGPGMGGGRLEEVDERQTESFKKPEIDECTALNINPFVWLSFRDGQLVANATLPHAISIPIDEVQFLVLNHCVVSKRGDRRSRSIDLIERFGIGKASLDVLLNGGLLLPASEVASLRVKIDLWCRRGWYQSLLAYLDMWSSLSNFDPHPPEVLGTEPPVAMQVDKSIWEHWELLRTQRMTTRAFTGEALSADITSAILECARYELLSEASDFHAHCVSFGRSRENTASIRVLSLDRDDFVELNRTIDRSTVYSNTIGQFPLQKAALVLWLEVTSNVFDASCYLNSLVRLGAIAQKLCVVAAERGVGVFMTPAVRDAATMGMLGQETDSDRMFYLLAFGEPITKEVRFRESSNGQQFEVSERLSGFEALLANGSTLVFDVDGETALVCDSNGVLTGVKSSGEDDLTGRPRC